MESKRHILNELWEQYPDIVSKKPQQVHQPEIENILGDYYALGPYYYYAINITNSTLSNCHENILHIHGLKKYPIHLKEIIDLVHPEDIDFVRIAENWALTKFIEIGIEHQLNLKIGYCFRMKTAEGNYELFHHQSLQTLKDDNDKIVQSVNIHTNIHHITQHNNHIATLTGIRNRNDFHQFHYDPQIPYEPIERLTKRELEVLVMLSKGYTDKDIAEKLCVSYHTARTHHKNILKKTMTKNGSEMVKKCIELGYL